jgi:uncharacterized protein
VRYRAPWWCFNGHLQTLWGPLLRRGRRRLRRERVDTPDGDFLDLDWLDGPEAAPLVLILYGLEGSVCSHYVVGLLDAVADHGWRAAVLNFRSCSGDLNRLPRFYHSGDTGDLHHVVGLLLERDPETRLGAVGVSLGGNVLLKWLGEQALEVPKQFVGAVAISAPFDLVACARVLDRGFARAVYTANFLRTMKRKARDKATRYPGFVDLSAVRQARTFAQYDRAVTAPLHGFTDEVDYWTRSSSGPYLARVGRPTLLINALDDPLVPRGALPDPRTLPACVEAEFVPRGGHVGFQEGPWPWQTHSWAERRALEFLASALA